MGCDIWEKGVRSESTALRKTFGMRTYDLPPKEKTPPGVAAPLALCFCQRKGGSRGAPVGVGT